MRPNVIRFSISHGEGRMYVTSGTDDPARLSACHAGRSWEGADRIPLLSPMRERSSGRQLREEPAADEEHGQPVAEVICRWRRRSSGRNYRSVRVPSRASSANAVSDNFPVSPRAVSETLRQIQPAGCAELQAGAFSIERLEVSRFGNPPLWVLNLCAGVCEREIDNDESAHTAALGVRISGRMAMPLRASRALALAPPQWTDSR